MGVVPRADGFLEFLREITKHYGALFIFDDNHPGFRLALGGAQEFVSYYAGSCPRLEKVWWRCCRSAPCRWKKGVWSLWFPRTVQVYQAGTLSGNPIAKFAGLAHFVFWRQIRKLYMRLQENTAMLADACAMPQKTVCM